MLIDCHIHFFPDKLYGKVFSKLSQIANCPYYRSESLSDTLTENSSQGVTHALALHIATNPKQQNSVNDFAISSQSENIKNFGSVHPLAENRIEQLYKLHENKIQGIKLHPDYQDFFVDDPKLAEIYETCQKLGLMIAFHAGKDPYSPNITHSTPQGLKQVANSYKNMKIITAHMGGMNMYDEVVENLVGIENVYFDTAMVSDFLNQNQFNNLINLHGVDKILFATDSPWSKANIEKKLIENSNLTQEEKDKIYYKNAVKLLKFKS